MPTVGVKKEQLFKALGRSFSTYGFSACNEYQECHLIWAGPKYWKRHSE